VDTLVADPASVRPAAADNRVVVLGTTLLKVAEPYRLAVYPQHREGMVLAVCDCFPRSSYSAQSPRLNSSLIITFSGAIRRNYSTFSRL
jgi:hypothetical protein